MRPGLKDATATDIGTDRAARRAVYITQPDDITPMLKILRDHSAELDLRLEGEDTEYTGRILDLGGDYFLLEDIRPRDGLGRLRRGTRLTFSARVEDLYICGEDCRITRVESERGLPYFRADLPRRLLRHRRRRHTRITLPPRVSPNDGIARVTRDTAASSPLHGRIIDISVSGCRIRFDGAVVPALRTDEHLTDCAIQVTSSLCFSTPAVIRHSAWDGAQRTTTCGVEFLDMSIPDRRRLEHYVSQLTGRNGTARS